MADTTSSSRRDFLLGAGLGTAAAAAAVAAVGTECRIPSGADEVAPERSSGYRASPHILKYYQTTEV